MSDTNNIKMNNGSIVSADLGFANKDTIENWYKVMLRQLQNDPTTSEWFILSKPSDFETNVLPVPLKDTSHLNSDILTVKEDYASLRAEMEARKFAAKFYDKNNSDNIPFYANHMDTFVSNVKQAFLSSDEKKGNVRLVSQNSFLRLSKAFVNILLSRKPDGTENIIRRSKAKPDVFDVDSSGNQVRVYYTNEEVIAGETELYTKYNAHNFLTLDLAHMPFGIEYSFLSASALMSVDRTERSDSVSYDMYDLDTSSETALFDSIKFNNEMFVDSLFNSSDESDRVVSIQLDEIAMIAKRDLGIINLVELRNKSGDILSVIHEDCSRIVFDQANLKNGTQMTWVKPKPKDNSDKLSMRERYMSLMVFVRIIVNVASHLIQLIIENSKKNTLNKKEIELIIGIESGMPGNYVERFEEMLSDDDFQRDLTNLSLKYRISERMFITLLVNIVRRATVSYGDKAMSIVDRFSDHIGYNKPNLNLKFVETFFKYLTVSVPETAVEDIQGLINTSKNQREPMASYAYRNVTRYINESKMFGMELGIIDSSVNIIDHKAIGSTKNPPQSYRMDANDFTFDVDSLVEVVSKIMGKTNLTDATNPFATYKTEIVKKSIELDARRKDVAQKLNEMYGVAFPVPYVKFPALPYNNTERLWASDKCIALEEKIKIITEMNPSYDWTSFRALFRDLHRMTHEFATARIEDPDVVANIKTKQDLFDLMCTECNLTSDVLSSFKKHEEDLIKYSNLDVFSGSFVPFEFKFKKDLDDEMSFHLGKTSILYNDNIRTVQSLLILSDYKVILTDYFIPFFKPFATVNVDAFDISFEQTQRVDNKMKNSDNPGTITDVIMIVRYGCSDDLHAASKFRTRFPCILDTVRMVREARIDAGKSEHDDFGFADINDKFIIKWARTKKQNDTLAGKAGESVLKLIASTKGCSEQYPAYDSMMSRIVSTFFTLVNSRYIQGINLRKARDDNLSRKAARNPYREVDDLGFGKISKATTSLIEQRANNWSNFSKNMKGEIVNVNSLLVDIVISNNEATKQPEVKAPIQLPFSQDARKSESRMGRASVGKKEGEHRVEETNKAEADTIRAFTREKNIKKRIVDPVSGFERFEYGTKTVTSYIKLGDSTPENIKQKRNNAGKTPDRHRGGMVNEGGRKPRHATGGSARRDGTPDRRGGTPDRRGGTPFRRNNSNASKATPIYLGNGASPYRNGGNSPYKVNSASTSPSAGKSGYVPGAASPANFGYLQPDHDLQQSYNPINVYVGAASPTQNQGQIFQEVDVPTDIFHARSSTPRDDGSAAATSVTSGATPTQDFEVDNNDDFEI